MLINWFTQPPAKFASYYQYDTVTQRFCRIRLELGRTSGSGDAKAMYEPRRAVGFSPNKNFKSDKSRWSVDDKGTLSYDGKPLSGKPTAGDWTYDIGIPTTSSAHLGNQVPADPPVLPPGIKAEHLALVANEAMLTRTEIKLAPGSVSPEKLATAIKTKVCEILKVDNFGAVNDELITTTLTGQAKALYTEAARGSVSGLNDALAAASSANELIGKQLENGLVPDKAIQEVFDSLQSALAKAGAASGSADIQGALDEIGKARQAVEKAISVTTVAENKAVTEQLDIATESLAQAEQSAARWQTAETEYKPLIEAENPDSYMEALSAEEEVL